MTLLPPQMDECIKSYLALKAKLGRFDLESHDLNGQYLFTSTDDGSRPYPTSSWTKVVKVRPIRACCIQPRAYTSHPQLTQLVATLNLFTGCVSSVLPWLEGARSKDAPQHLHHVDAQPVRE